MRRIRSALCCTLAATAALFAAPQLSAQPYPSKPVKIVVAFAPGGGNDLIARFVAQRLSTALGQQFIIENKPGAGGSIGFEAGVRSQPDGYTLTLISPSYTTNPNLYKLSFDPVADITPIVQISQEPLIVVVNPSLPAKNIQELIALTKAKPGTINFASSGSGSVIHLAGELFAIKAGIKLTHVPYKGNGPALTDTLAGQTNLMLGTNSDVMPHVRAGRLRALAVTTTQRLPVELDIPTVAEAGVPGYEVIVWFGLIGPKGLPRPIVDRIHGEVMAWLKLPETGERLRAQGSSPAGGTPEQFLATIKRDIVLWREIVREAGLQPE